MLKNKPTRNSEVLSAECQVLTEAGKAVDFMSCYYSADGRNEWVDPTTTKRMFDEIVSKLDDPSRRTILDCGSGLGYVLYLAYPFFRKVRGVEIIEDVWRTSIHNLETLLPSNDIDVFLGDMFQLSEEIWDSSDVFFISSPFPEESLIRKLVGVVAGSIDRAPRDVYAIYYYPYCQHVFKGFESYFTLENKVVDIGEAQIYHHKADGMDRNRATTS